MKTIAIYDTMQQSGYEYIGYIGHGQHVLRLGHGVGAFEVWGSNKNHANYGIIYKNTHLEFCRTATEREKLEAVL